MATALVTGANRGIGLELCRLLRGRGDEVIGVCRTPSEALSSLGVRVESGVDVTEADAVRRLGEKLADTRLDLLVNNAGLLGRDTLEELDFDGVHRQMEVNAYGPLRVTHALLPSLREGSKVAILTSRMGSIADNTSGGYYGYRMSKAAVNAAGKSLAEDLRGRGVAVIILHPGFVRTDMTNRRGDVEPQDAARGLLARVDELTIDRTGEFRHQNGQPLPW